MHNYKNQAFLSRNAGQAETTKSQSYYVKNTYPQTEETQKEVTISVFEVEESSQPRSWNSSTAKVPENFLERSKQHCSLGFSNMLCIAGRTCSNVYTEHRLVMMDTG